MDKHTAHLWAFIDRELPGHHEFKGLRQSRHDVHVAVFDLVIADKDAGNCLECIKRGLFNDKEVDEAWELIDATVRQAIIDVMEEPDSETEPSEG